MQIVSSVRSVFLRESGLFGVKVLQREAGSFRVV